MKTTAIAAAFAVALTSGLAVADDAKQVERQALMAESPLLLTDDEMDSTVAGQAFDNAALDFAFDVPTQPSGRLPWPSNALCVNGAAAAGFQSDFTQGAQLSSDTCF